MNIICEQADACNYIHDCTHRLVHSGKDYSCMEDKCTSPLEGKCVYLPYKWKYICEHYKTCEQKNCCGKNPIDAKSMSMGNIIKVSCSTKGITDIGYIVFKDDNFDGFINEIFNEAIKEI